MSKKQKIDPVWLSIKLEEYRSLRKEIIDCGSLSISILRFGILTISGLLYFALTKDSLTIIIFLLFCPLICYSILFIWLGEIVRIFRAAFYIKTEIEQPIITHFNNHDHPLYWEHWLRENSGKERLYKWHRGVTVTLFLITAIISIIIGVCYCSKEELLKYSVLIYLDILLFLIISMLIYYIYKSLQDWGKVRPEKQLR